MKRILALDGGGIRGVFSLQILARIEDLFRQEQGKSDLVLADVFDLFAGTSTGAIIATCLSWRMTVSEIDQLYTTRGAEMFAKENWQRRWWKTKYRAKNIADLFRDTFCEDSDGRRVPALLGTNRIEKLLLVIMRNASTGSPWPVSNNRRATYNDPALPDCNLSIPLWQLLRASTAAPSYFPPEEIVLGGRKHMFVDGGISSFNNPALIAVLMATLPPYHLCWPATREELHVISVGTGGVRVRLPQKLAEKINILDQIRFVASALIASASVEQDILCRIMGDCVHGAAVDSEIGKLDRPTLFGATEQKFTYTRYDQALDATDAKIRQLSASEAKMDNLRLIPVLQEVGREYASEHVRIEDLYPRRTQNAPQENRQ
jgi:hypothetical protein